MKYQVELQGKTIEVDNKKKYNQLRKVAKAVQLKNTTDMDTESIALASGYSCAGILRKAAKQLGVMCFTNNFLHLSRAEIMEYVEKHRSGKTMDSLSYELGISTTTLRKWFKSVHYDVKTKSFSIPERAKAEIRKSRPACWGSILYSPIPLCLIHVKTSSASAQAA